MSRSSQSGRAKETISGCDAVMAGLPPKQAETLGYLLDGLAEKQVALKMGLSYHTVHQYVKLIYKRLNVSSRAQLMARMFNENQSTGS